MQLTGSDQLHLVSGRVGNLNIESNTTRNWFQGGSKTWSTMYSYNINENGDAVFGKI